MPDLHLYIVLLGAICVQCAKLPDIADTGDTDVCDAKGNSLLAIKRSLTSVQPQELRALQTDSAIESPGKKMDALLPAKGCKATFLDLGANSGDTVNAFLHAETGQPKFDEKAPKWNPLNPITGDFDYGKFQHALRKIFDETQTSPNNYCIVGVEANTAWAAHFARFRSHYAMNAEFLGMYSGLAVGLEDGPMDFQCAHVNPKRYMFGDGQPDENLSRFDQYPCKIQSRSLPSILQELHGRSANVLIIKMDVESVINTVFPAFVQSGALEALSAEKVHTYMLVDPTHMSLATLELFESLRDTPHVTWQQMFVHNKDNRPYSRREELREEENRDEEEEEEEEEEEDEEEEEEADEDLDEEEEEEEEEDEEDDREEDEIENAEDLHKPKRQA